MNETCQCLAGGSLYSNATPLTSTKHHGSKMSSFDNLLLNGTNGTMSEECHPYVPDVFMFSVILFFFTFVIAFGLKMLRHSPFFPTKVNYTITFILSHLPVISMSGSRNHRRFQRDHRNNRHERYKFARGYKSAVSRST